MTHPRFASFSVNGKQGYGLVKGEAIVDLSSRHGAKWPTLREVIEAGALRQLATEAADLEPDIMPGTFRFEIPIPAPEKLICVGVNFPDRNEEYKDGQAAPPNPSLFIRFPRSFTGHDQPLIRPPESPQLDYEGEIVIIIGKGGRRIAEAKDQPPGAVVLPRLSIDPRGDADVGDLAFIDVGYDPGAEAAGGVKVLALGDVELGVPHPVADGAFIAERYGGDVIQRVALPDVPAGLADDKHQFALVVELL